MQSYDEIVNSGTDWLGYIPAQWSIRRGKFLYQNKKVVNKGMAETQRLALTLRGVIERKDGDNLGLNPESLESYQIFEKNDLVFKLIDLENKQTSRVGLTPKRGIMSPAYIRLTPKLALSPGYFFYYYYSLYLTYVFNNIAGEGVRANLSAKELLELPAPVPSLQTQQKIADFLDTETAQIDNLIAKQERLLELLEEKRRATITHAVTRGLNPSVELKETNIPWLGKVPVGWLSSKLGHYLKYVGSGVTPRGGAETYTDSGVKFLRSQNVHNGYISDGNMTFITPNVHEEMRRSKLQSEDVLLNITGGSIGRSTVVPSQFGEANVNQHVCALRTVKNKLDPHFLSYILRSNLGQSQIFGLQLGSNREGLNYDQIRNLVIALPDINQQLEIVAFLNMQEEKSELLKQKIQTQITLLRERRTSLISHAVTGKVMI
jgi:type I restriction enzyme S subunit